MQCDFVFAYLRLSRDDKEKMEESNSIKNQRLLIQHFVENQPEFAGAKFFFFVDDGYSGTTFDRPEFKRMMGLITRRKRICIIVKDLSRLGRDTIETQNYIEKIFPFLGVRFISINDFYDSSQKPSERKDTEIKFKNLINGIYPQICSNNIKKVMRKQAEMGQYHGSIPTYGYCFHDGVHTKLHLDMEAASVVRGIFDQRLEGKTYADIARDLNKKEVETPTVYLQRKGWAPEAKKSVKFWDGNLVKLILFNPVYAGLTVRGKTETRVPSKREYRYISREDAIIVTLSLIIVLSFYLLHRREVTRLSQKLQTLLHSFTHAELTLDFPSSDITDLVNALNELFRVYHKQVYSLQKKDEAIKETITNLAHDLRTPVTAIQGYTQMLLQSPELSEEDLDAAAVINERLNVLNQLLNQLFEFARIEADEMEFSYTTFDLNAVLRSVAVSFFKSFEERKIIPALSIAEISFPFYGDEKAVTRIFENIISNALSHGKSDYHFSSYDDNENYHFSFQNFTDSINESDIDKIFNRFYTTDLSRSRKTTGLGLTIAKNLTVKMGGSISASLNNNVFEIVVCFPKQKG